MVKDRRMLPIMPLTRGRTKVQRMGQAVARRLKTTLTTFLLIVTIVGSMAIGTLTVANEHVENLPLTTTGEDVVVVATNGLQVVVKHTAGMSRRIIVIISERLALVAISPLIITIIPITREVET